jgi:hypothetical protein
MLVVLILHVLWIVVANVQAAAQFALSVTMNYCMDDFLAVFWCAAMNVRQCAIVITQNAPQATALAYYPGNRTCYTYVNTTITNVVAYGLADPLQSICSFYTQQVSIA